MGTSHSPEEAASNPALGAAAGLTAFDFTPRTRVVFGAGKFLEVGTLSAELKLTRVLVVTDRGLTLAGHVQPAIDALESAGIQTAVFDAVTPNPTTDDVARGLKIAQAINCDGIIGLGGGSSMDCAKGVNFLFTNGGKMEDYWGTGKARLPLLPMIAIPTTAGTGSDAQSYALIAQAGTHMKMACGDPKAAFRIAILDPRLTSSMPPFVTAATGIDAVSHAVESFVCTRRNPISRLFSLNGWQLLARGFPAVLQNPADLDARSRMLLGAHLAGAAIENSMLGAAHAAANPLTAAFDVTHGVAVAVMLPHVVRFNASVVGSSYGELAASVQLCRIDDPDAADKLAQLLTQMNITAGLPTRLRECGVNQNRIPEMAEQARAQWTAGFNPRPPSVNDFVSLYNGAF